MDDKLINETYREYLNKREKILEEHGEEDGFVISGTTWWEYYEKLIKDFFAKYEAGTLDEKGLLSFYTDFGFAVKIYTRSFVENGVDAVINTLKFLNDKRIGAEEKLREIVEESDSPYNLRGIGINFVTLYLTVRFPKEYAQWNAPIDVGLKVLKAYPEKPRGMKKSEFYKHVNDSILRISEIVNEPFLPHLDNYLFSLARGYVGEKRVVLETVDEEVRELEKDIKRVKPTKKYLAVQYYLIITGIGSGFDVWVASNDREESYSGIKFSSLALEEIPVFGAPKAISMSKRIDVIWFEKGSHKPVRFFEIEHTTPIYSGLLRLNDVLMDYPIPKATIVVPEDRLDKVDTEINRPTFRDLAVVCNFLTYKEVEEWYEATQKIEKYR